MNDALSFGPQATLPLTNSVLFDRPYLNIRKNHSKKQKPNFSKLSILTKSSICSMKNGVKENVKVRGNSKTVNRNTKRRNKSKTKRREDSQQHKSVMTRTTKIDAFGNSQEHYGL